MNTTTQMHPQHTPTPWHVGRIVGHFCGIYAERGAQIADCTSPDFFPEDSKHNAAFIVRACNSHAQLVAALETLLSRAGQLDQTATAYGLANADAIAKARAALAAAQS